MEKLQAALAKARETRQKRLGTSPASSNRQPLTAARDTRWSAIEEISLSGRAVERQRLVALQGGSDATAFDMLRTKVLQLTSEHGWRRIAITSPAAGSGKTTTALNLGASLSRHQDLRITLMDMDMRRPALAKVLNHAGENSVVDVLKQRCAFGTQARRLGANLALSMNYKAYRDPSDLFLRAQTGEVLSAIEGEFQPDIMLFDMPPMLVNDDTAAFLKNVDCALIVAEAGVSTAQQIDHCERELASQTNVLGVVLNKCRDAGSGYGYGYGY